MSEIEIIQPESALVTGSNWLADTQDLSAASKQAALNIPLGSLVQTYLAAAAGDSPHTARAYQGSVGLFLAWLSNELSDSLPADWLPLAISTEQELIDKRHRHYTKNVWEFRGCAAVLRAVTAGTLDNFTAWRASEGDGRGTQALRRRAVTSFLRVALRDNVLTVEQATNLGIKPYRAKEKSNTRPVGRRLSRDEVRALRAAVAMATKNQVKQTRDTALLDAMLYAGLRREEVAHLQTNNLVLDGGRWWLVLTGKGSKVRRVKVHDVLYKSLSAWAKLAGVILGEGDTVLFRNVIKGGELNGPLSASVIGRLMAEYGHLAGLAPAKGENILSPHDLRRTCARNAFDNGASLMHVQAMLGHSDPKTTERYIGVLQNDDDTAVDYVKY